MDRGYLAEEFVNSKFYLVHYNVQDFYLSCCQTNIDKLPTLCLRALIFLTCLGTLLASIILIDSQMKYYFWPIYLTHWNIILITLTSFFALYVSYLAHIRGQIGDVFQLIWPVQVYWALFNAAISISILITILYYSFLSTLKVKDLSVDPTLDVFLHAMPSVLMLTLLLTSRQPMNILHFYFPLIFGLIYLAFNLIYYLAGGTDPLGKRYIYPNLDWGNASKTLLLSIFIAIVIVVLHLVAVALTLLRNYLTRDCLEKAEQADLQINPL